MARKYDETEGEKPIQKNITLESFMRDLPGVPNDVFYSHSFMGSKKPLEFWKWLFEPEATHEVLRRDPDRWPYAMRIVRCSCLFLQLDADSREYVLRARRTQQPIWWRGDDMNWFKIIAKESHRYHQLTDEQKQEYRKNAMAQVRRINGNA